MILSAAIRSAEPPTVIERDPKVPRPIETASVFPWTSRTQAKSTPSQSETIWA